MIFEWKRNMYLTVLCLISRKEQRPFKTIASKFQFLVFYVGYVGLMRMGQRTILSLNIYQLEAKEIHGLLALQV